MKQMKRWSLIIVAALSVALITENLFAIDMGKIETDLKSGELRLAFPKEVGSWPEAAAPATRYTWDNIKARIVNGKKIVYYKTAIWGKVEANFEDFRNKVAETLNDERGWSRANIRFVEVKSGYDLTIVLSDPGHLDFPGCSPKLSCTDSNRNYVIINDVRWRTGTDASNAHKMSQRDYQHMVVNHEMGHWMGHHTHTQRCSVNGGPAPIMLQQSSGLVNCGSMNPWPLKEELWVKI